MDPVGAVPTLPQDTVPRVGPSQTPDLPRGAPKVFRSPARSKGRPLSRPLEGTPGTCQKPRTLKAFQSPDTAPTPSQIAERDLTPERETQPSARPRVPQSPQSPQRELCLLGVSAGRRNPQPLRGPHAKSCGLTMLRTAGRRGDPRVWRSELTAALDQSESDFGLTSSPSNQSSGLESGASRGPGVTRVAWREL